MIKNKIRVLIIEDSRLYQMYLKQVIEADECLMVAGIADCGEKALEIIPALSPDIITLDLRLPDMDGFELLEDITRKWKVPVIVVTENADACERSIALGACDFIAKIQDTEPGTAEQFRLLLKLKLKMQAETRSEAPRRASVKRPAPAAEQRSLSSSIIAIGASLGGTETTLRILRQLPDNLPGIVIVQHMPPEYTNAYAMRLDHCCGLTAREARNGELILPGTALVARGGEQLTVYRTEQGYRARVGGTEKVGGFCPSVDALFHSVAKAAGADALGALLTGMGRDGAEGLKEMHDNKAYTLGQSEESRAVFGMPKAAWELGGVDKLLPPDKIAEEIIQHFHTYGKSEADKK